MGGGESGKKSKGPLRAFSDWLKGTEAEGKSAAAPAGAADAPERIGHYAIRGRLGQGGMGVVYAAWDERLERPVALKKIASVASDETARRRFWREARAAASVNHPGICQLYEIGEAGGEPFIAMELLEGEPLAARLGRGPLSPAEAVPIALAILAALQALHTRGVVHRDLKPSNVFLTPHGVKLLDFGLARASDGPLGGTGGSRDDITRTGMIVGTPRYMAPEQVTGEEVDARSDLFAVGAILFEMLAGRPAFDGRTVVEIAHATLYEQPPALTGSPAIAAVDRVLRQALAKRPEERPASAEAMAEGLTATRRLAGDETPPMARALTRLVVLPFRVLRPDPETDFLAFSLPDAIATSLARNESLVVRSSATAARFGGDTPDLKALAAEADVDRVVMGTLLRGGDQLRVTTQLVEAPAGTLLRSGTVEASLGDLFRLQDDIARRVVEGLSLPLVGEASPTPAAPRDAAAYELYLRANELARRYENLIEARDLYRQYVERDPGFAPAWAQLGRAERLTGKYLEAPGDANARAEQALRRALELDPRLTLAHRYYAYLEAETGKPRAGMERLLRQADRHGNDAELFAGLVQTCRYCGLLEESIAAHDEARRLDPNVPTSFEHTHLMRGDVERLLAIARTTAGVSGGVDEAILAVGLGLAGRRDEAVEALERLPESGLPAFQSWVSSLRGWLGGKPEDLDRATAELANLRVMRDPEAAFEMACLHCDLGKHEVGLELLKQSIDMGYTLPDFLARSKAFDGMRGEPAFQDLVAAAAAGRDAALATFRELGGERLLGRLARSA